MLLAIDSGNTNTTFAVFENGKPRAEWRSATNPNRTVDEYAVWLVQLMALKNIAPGDIDGAIIANVVPKTEFSLLTLCRQYFNCEPLRVGADNVELGIEVKIDNPSEVGADRLVNVVGADGTYTPPLILIDFGTATTFDIVDNEGNYAGGIIAPGINLSLEALDAAAARLPRIRITRPKAVIGKSTVPAMESGVYWGYVGLIEGLVKRTKEEYGADMTVVATGGLAPLFDEATDAIDHVDPDMTMRGLMEIYRLNTSE